MERWRRGGKAQKVAQEGDSEVSAGKGLNEKKKKNNFAKREMGGTYWVLLMDGRGEEKGALGSLS